MYLKLCSALAILQLVYTAPVPPGREPGPQCDPGEENDCTKCYDVLANEIVFNDRNRFNLQRAFFPPIKSSPVFMEVVYMFTRNLTGDGTTNYTANGANETWFWTASTIYLYQPVDSLQFTSLFFADPATRSDIITLFLQPSCINSTNDMKILLTQRLKVYAMEQTIAAGVDGEYDAKGFSDDTLVMFQQSQDEIMENPTLFAVSFQIIFPILMVFFFCLVLYYVIYKPDLYRIRTGLLDESIKKEHDDYLDDAKVPSKKNLRIVILVLSSFMFVLFCIVLDIAAVYFFLRVTTEIHMSAVHEFEMVIPIIMLVEDTLVLLIMIISFFSCFCSHITPRWYFILLGPLSSIAVHFYHIMLGFIETPRHAGSIAIAYGVIISIFLVTLNVAYYSLYGLYNWSKKRYHYQKYNKSRCEENEGSQTQRSTDKHAHKHKFVKFHPYPCPHSCFAILLFIIAVLMALFTAYVLALFFIVPINRAVEDAALSLQTINNVIVIFFTGVITIKIFKEKKQTIIDLLVHIRNRDTKTVDPNQNTNAKAKVVVANKGNKEMQAAANKLRNEAWKHRIEKAANDFVTEATDRLITAASQQVKTTPEFRAQGTERMAMHAAACEIVCQRAEQLHWHIKVQVQTPIASDFKIITKALEKLVNRLNVLFTKEIELERETKGKIIAIKQVDHKYEAIKEFEGQIKAIKRVGEKILQVNPGDKARKEVLDVRDAAHNLMKTVAKHLLKLQSTPKKELKQEKKDLIQSIRKAPLHDHAQACSDPDHDEFKEVLILLDEINDDHGHGSSTEPSSNQTIGRQTIPQDEINDDHGHASPEPAQQKQINDEWVLMERASQDVVRDDCGQVSTESVLNGLTNEEYVRANTAEQPTPMQEDQRLRASTFQPGPPQKSKRLRASTAQPALQEKTEDVSLQTDIEEDNKRIQVAVQDLVQAVCLFIAMESNQLESSPSQLQFVGPMQQLPHRSNRATTSNPTIQQIDHCSSFNQADQQVEPQKAVNQLQEQLLTTASEASQLMHSGLTSAGENVKAAARRLVKAIAPNAVSQGTPVKKEDELKRIAEVISAEICQYFKKDGHKAVQKAMSKLVDSLYHSNSEVLHETEEANQLIESVVEAETSDWLLLQEISNQLLGQKSKKNVYQETAKLVILSAAQDLLQENQRTESKCLKGAKLLCCCFSYREVEEELARKILKTKSVPNDHIPIANKLLEEVVEQVDKTIAEEVHLAARRASPKLAEWEEKSGRERKEAMGSFLLQTLVSLKKSL